MRLSRKKSDKLQEALRELEASGLKVKNVKKVMRGHKVTVSAPRIIHSDYIDDLAKKFEKHGYVLERPVFHTVDEGSLHMFIHKKKRFGIF